MNSNLNVFFFYFHLSKVGGKSVVLGNLASKDSRKLDIKDAFIQEIIELWTLTIGIPLPLKLISALDIWNNSMITIAGYTKFYKH